MKVVWTIRYFATAIKKSFLNVFPTFKPRPPRCTHKRAYKAPFCDVSLQKYSKPVLAIMSRAGWFCGRRLPVQPTALSFQTMRQLVAEFGGLNFMGSGSLNIYEPAFHQGVPFGTTDVSRTLGRPVARFGCTNALCDTSELFIDDCGCVYIFDYEMDTNGNRRLYRFGEDIYQGLESFLSGEMDRRFAAGHLEPNWSIPAVATV